MNLVIQAVALVAERANEVVPKALVGIPWLAGRTPSRAGGSRTLQLLEEERGHGLRKLHGRAGCAGLEDPQPAWLARQRTSGVEREEGAAGLGQGGASGQPGRDRLNCESRRPSGEVTQGVQAVGGEQGADRALQGCRVPLAQWRRGGGASRLAGLCFQRAAAKSLV